MRWVSRRPVRPRCWARWRRCRCPRTCRCPRPRSTKRCGANITSRRPCSSGPLPDGRCCASARRSTTTCPSTRSSLKRSCRNCVPDANAPDSAEAEAVRRAAVAVARVAVVADLAAVEDAVAAAGYDAGLPAGGGLVERLDRDGLGHHEPDALAVVAHPAPGGDAHLEARRDRDLPGAGEREAAHNAAVAVHAEAPAPLGGVGS